MRSRREVRAQTAETFALPRCRRAPQQKPSNRHLPVRRMNSAGTSRLT